MLSVRSMLFAKDINIYGIFVSVGAAELRAPTLKIAAILTNITALMSGRTPNYQKSIAKAFRYESARVNKSQKSEISGGNFNFRKCGD